MVCSGAGALMWCAEEHEMADALKEIIVRWTESCKYQGLKNAVGQYVTSQMLVIMDRSDSSTFLMTIPPRLWPMKMIGRRLCRLVSLYSWVLCDIKMCLPMTLSSHRAEPTKDPLRK